MISPARTLAFDVLRKVHQGGYASDLLREGGSGREGASVIDARDAGLAETIVLGCLRVQSQLDFLIGHFSGRTKLDPEVRIALRMGIYQLRYLDRIPRHAAVAESVELVKRARKQSAAGLVNAVLRKLSLENASRDPIPWPDLATELAVPAWMLERWQRQYGAEQAATIAQAGLREPETPLNTSTGRQQAAGSQAIVPLLKLEAGMSLLDLCAAPGNKTAQALAAGVRVVAADRYLKRLTEVPPAAERVVLDATQPLPLGRAKFDRILVDVPCSGTGTLARNPEIKWRLREQDLDRFTAMQRAIVRNAMDHLKPEGRLVYATCSLEREENEEIVEGMGVSETRTWLPGPENSDGFFAAVITLEKL